MQPEKGQTWVRLGAPYPDGACYVVDVHEDRVEFTPSGGGFVYTAPVASFLERHVYRAPGSPPAPWRTGWFALEDEGPWPGVWQGHRWNGWATPSFDRGTLEAVLRDLDATWRMDGDVFVMDWTGEEVELRLEPQSVDVNGTPTLLYQFDGWCFDEVDAPARRRERLAEFGCTDSPECAARGCADCERSYGPRR